MSARLASVVSSVFAMVLATYAFDIWQTRSREAGCVQSVAALRTQFEQHRARIRNPGVLDGAITRAGNLCADGKFTEARQLLNVTLATCRHTGGCVLKSRS